MNKLSLKAVSYLCWWETPPEIENFTLWDSVGELRTEIEPFVRHGVVVNFGFNEEEKVEINWRIG